MCATDKEINLPRDRTAKMQGYSYGARFLQGAVVLLIFSWPIPMHGSTENYWVAVDQPNASDSNDGLSLDRPFKTLSRAVRDLSPGDTLFIKKGIYREALSMGNRNGTPNDPIVIRAYPGDQGEVVIRGSNVVKGWTSDGGGVWSVPWQPLPLLDYSSWPDADEYSQRREIVFIDGSPLKQVLSQAGLAAGRFWMDDEANRLRIYHLGDPNNSQVEVSVRTEGIMARGRSHLVFRGLRVEHVSSEKFIGAMSLGSHNLVEDCRVEYNNGDGIEAYSDSMIVRTTSSHNGRLGIGLSGSNSIVDSSETSYNSWRYGPKWEAGGVKMTGSLTGSGNRFVRHTSSFNNGPGIWLDNIGTENVVEASVLEGNIRAGIFFEAMGGPNWVINNVILGTRKEGIDLNIDGVGILIESTLDTCIFNNTIVGVAGSGVAIFGGGRNDGQHYCANTRVFNNIIVDPGQSAIQFKVWGVSLDVENRESHDFDHNLYFGGNPTIAYPWGNWSLSEWQVNRGEDLKSRFASPEFTRPSSGDFTLQATSPAIDAGRELAEVTEDRVGVSLPQGDGTDIGAYEKPADAIGPKRPSSRLLPLSP